MHRYYKIKQTMKKHIYLDKKSKAKLQLIFNVSNVMVWKALTFESNSELARKIRHTAMHELGGLLVGDGTVKDWETTFQTAENTMTQTFGSHVKIIVSMDIKLASVLIDGEVRDVKHGISVNELVTLQEEALTLASDLQRQ